MGEEIKISVRDLVEFVLRSGDLDEGSSGVTEEAMLEGARMHRKLQREAGPEYTAEVPLSIYYPVFLPQEKGVEGSAEEENSAKCSAEEENSAESPAEEEAAEQAAVLLEGRADGIFYGSDPERPIFGDAWTIDEIKTTYKKISGLTEPEPVHLAQAKCYAYIYTVQNDLDVVRVRMTYCSLATEQVKRFTEEYTAAEIGAWFDDLMREYSRWAGLEIRWRRIRDASLRDLEFPFSYRPGQRDLAVHVYHTICHGKKLFLEAPTGTGKTISAVFPALKAMGEGKADRLFYFTAKTVTGQVAMETFSILREQGMRLKSVQLTAKDKICPMETRLCTPEACPWAKGHYDRVNEALFDLLTKEENVSREVLLAYGEKYQVCPFELGLDVSLFTDAMIGDYNYLFDPHARLRRFFAEGKSRDKYLFLVDEAHNLVDRGRDMYSASLSREEVRVFRSVIRDVYPALWKKLGKLLTAFKPYKEAFEDEGALPPGTRFLEVMGGREKVLLAEEIEAAADTAYKVLEEMQSILGEQRKGNDTADREAAAQVQENFLTAYFDLSHFLMIYEGMEEGYQIYIDKGGREDLTIRLFCVDPSGKLSECLQKGEASVLFSATLLPIRYYKRLLGGTDEDYEVYARSSFDPEKLGLFIAGDVTSRFRMRGTEQYERIAACIHSTVSQRHGNYMVFFPSYKFLDKVLERYGEMHPEDDETAFAVQSPMMTEVEREAFLERFEEARDDRSLIGFCVLGGIFSEGIDLRQDRLIGALIVGTGFPQVCAEREILKQFFDSDGENGFDYAYRFPGMNKVLQAAGRVIRTAKDVGVVVLMDDRFRTGQYQRLFPAEWRGSRLTDSFGIGDKVSRFWDEWL